MQNPNAKHDTAPGWVRASRILSLLGVFVAIPAAGPAQSTPETRPVDSAISSPRPPSGVIAQFPLGQNIVGVANGGWIEDLRQIIDRLQKTLGCLEAPPGPETPEDSIERLRNCWQSDPLPSPLSPEQRDAIRRDVEDLFGHLAVAPGSISAKTIDEGVALAEDILAQINAQ